MLEEAPETSITPSLESQVDIESLYQNEKERIQGLYQNVWVWHGTKRYSPANEGVIDVLESIADEGALIPNQDFWNGSKAVETVSAAPSRPYAAWYSDLPFKRESNTLLFEDDRPMFRKTLRRHVHPRYWGSLIKNGPHLISTWGKGRRWMKDKKAPIPNNYPILIGLREGSFQPMKTEKFLEATELRTDKPISISGVNHIEVPLNRMAETVDILTTKGIDVPVIPRELGERFQTEFSKSDLVSGKAFHP